MSIRLYIGNLPKEEVNRDELQAIFAEAGENFSTKVIKDRKTGKCRGFGFVTVATDEEADQFIEKFNGHMFKDTTLKIEKALPRSKNQDKEASKEKEKPNQESTPSANNTPPPRRNNNKNKSKRKQQQTTSDPAGIQPDPRWANELAKLKELLSAQTTNS
ncbi:MAG: RNA-binding protein [Moorea sp. SIO1F2]|uniref:RNA recognition motif domain-containing protein n=1 Tax=unclassified Moorena TaxID=2683338 RepID=UPI0013B77136|nr:MULTISPECIES: RNA-binding protein [unclassified Moorena]NEN98404.1 RNA-binding protein [Moorena sp. SIO3I7]NEO66477.1 RNA-binding protein [Moorena sp. SIO4G2]NEO07355.1 RNA-binding protein [Moorena sp. SIO3I8]NEO21618.1 RNA-binding protein [Moorena sp. SIO4A5]NEP24116.1 RNA-binding protein [Moorena sp. SIO3I6]